MACLFGHKWEGARCARCGATQLSGVLTDKEISDVVKCLGTMKTTLEIMAGQGDAFCAGRVNVVQNLLSMVQNGDVFVDKYIWVTLGKTLEDGLLFGYFTDTDIDDENVRNIIEKMQNA